jgi:hypothetical protein
MDVNKAFRFVFDDKQWISKLLIGAVMSVLAFFIVPAFILQGYLVKLVRQVMDGNDNQLPEWMDYGKLLRDGFFVTVGQLIWVLPFILLFIILGAATGGFGSMADNGSGFGAAMATGSGLLLACVVLLMVVAFLFISPALLIQYAREDEFGALFRFSEIFDIVRDNMADILITFLVSVVAVLAISVVAGIVGIVPCLGWIAAALIALASGPYVQFVTGHLYGQIAAKLPGSKASGYYPPSGPGVA